MTESDRIGTKVCPACRSTFSIDSVVCSGDGTLLMVRAHDKLIGKVFGDRFELVEWLADGGTSRVYIAEDESTGKRVAVKFIDERRFTAAQCERLKQRLVREQETTSRFGFHKNIVTMIAVGEGFIATELVDGISLTDLIQEAKNLQPAHFLSVFGQICQALQHAHDLETCHSDLKPNDILLSEKDDGSLLVRLLDFGKGPALLHSDNWEQQLTEVGDIFGDSRYLSPEQCNNQPIDARSNIYSVGCMLYETLTGTPPFDGEHWGAVLIKKMLEKVPDTSSFDHTSLENPLMTIALKAMAFEPGDRFQSAFEFKQELLKCGGAEELPSVSYSDFKDCLKKKETISREPVKKSRSWLSRILGS